MLSGIGDSAALERLGIEPIVHLPDVGRNLQDHPIVSNFFLVNPNSDFSTWDDILRNTSLINSNLEQWMTSGTGIFADSPAASLGFTRLPEDASIFQQVPDPSSGSYFSTHLAYMVGIMFEFRAGPKSAHIELIFTVRLRSTSKSVNANTGSYDSGWVCQCHGLSCTGDGELHQRG